MKKLFFILLVGVLVTLVAVPLSAQDGGPGEGGTVILSDSSEPSNMIPFMSSDTTSSGTWGWLYPGLMGLNIETGALEPGYKDSLATGWEFNEDGTVLTITLREDAFWNDGTQITAQDHVWVMDALRSGLLDTPRSQAFETLDDGTAAGGTVVDVVALDDFTVEYTFNKPDCVVLKDVLPYTVPSHIYDAEFGDDLALLNETPMFMPDATFGPFKDFDFVEGERWSVLADQDYPDADLGYVSPAELIQITVPDTDVEVERFLAGEVTMLAVPTTRQAEIETDDNFQTYQFNSRGYSFITFNLADPENPQPGLDEDGNVLEQDPHPILADKRVRQALVMAIDYDAVIEQTLDGRATNIGTPSFPLSWDFNPDLVYDFDVDGAVALLEEAGWTDADGDGVRECNGCLHAEEGTAMVMTLDQPDGSAETTNERYDFIAQSWRDIGVDVTVERLDWGSAFLPRLDGQEYDMMTLGWSVGLPLDPDNTQFFGVEADVPGSGFNFGSYYNEEVEQLFKDARDPAKTEGCTIEGRKPYYDRINEIMFDEQPYFFMHSTLSLTAVQGNVENWQPASFSRTYQLDAVSIPE